MVKRPLGVLAIGISSVGVVLAQQPAVGPGPQRSAVAQRAAAAIHVDGRLDEADWLLAVPIGPFLQQVPQQGQPRTPRFASSTTKTLCISASRVSTVRHRASSRPS